MGKRDTDDDDPVHFIRITSRVDYDATMNTTTTVIQPYSSIIGRMRVLLQNAPF